MPKATVRTIGMLNTLRPLEALLATLRGRDAATSDDGTGLVISKVNPAKQRGNDDMRMELWCIRNLGQCIFEIPEGVEVEHVEDGPTGPYTFVRIGGRETGVSFHLHGGIHGDDSSVVVAGAKLYIRTFHPEGADKRQKGRQAWKNYVFYVDMHPWDGEEQANQRIVVLNPLHPMYTPRSEAILLGAGDSLDFATRSANWDAQERRGINQHLRIVKVAPGQHDEAQQVEEPTTATTEESEPTADPSAEVSVTKDGYVDPTSLGTMADELAAMNLPATAPSRTRVA